jgi:hypothetical protein
MCLAIKANLYLSHNALSIHVDLLVDDINYYSFLLLIKLIFGQFNYYLLHPLVFFFCMLNTKLGYMIPFNKTNCNLTSHINFLKL